MTVSDVKAAVIAYGYTNDLEGNDRLFLEALNMAVQEINRLRPATDTIEIVHEPYEPIYAVREVTEISDGMSFTAVARSAVFEVDGKGAFNITATDEKGGPVTVYIGNSVKSSLAWEESTSWKRIVVRTEKPANIEIKFSIEYVSRMRNLEFYDEAIPPTAHIKSGDYVEYDLAKLESNFKAVSYILRDGVEYVGDGSYRIINGNKLRLPARDRGTYEVLYKKNIAQFRSDSEPINLRYELLVLLPYLVASYVWEDDAPERSQAYRAKFERNLASIPTETYVTNIYDPRGWA
jgi:hypothetical protein